MLCITLYYVYVFQDSLSDPWNQIDVEFSDS